LWARAGGGVADIEIRASQPRVVVVVLAVVAVVVVARIIVVRHC
jgi:hypothetical protein